MISSRSVPLVAVPLLLAACSIGGQSVGDAGEEAISEAISEQLGFELSDVSCEEPAETEVGEEFTCTAVSPDGATVTFDGVVESDDEIFVAPTNVVLGEEMSIVEQESAQVLGQELAVEIDPSDVDCPDETTVLGDGGTLRCEITDASNGDVYELTATFGDYVLREGFGDRFYEIGDAPL